MPDEWILSRRRILLGTAALACAGAAPADVALSVVDGRCVVPVRLDGRPAAMIVDTGAARTVMTHAAALRLGLRRDLWVDTTMQGAGGLLETHPNVDVQTATLGGRVLSQGLPGGGLSLSVTTLDLGGADGLLGGDVLRHTTLDLDAPNAVLTLQSPSFPVGSGAVPLTRWAADLLLAPVTLDEQNLTALVDTGAAVTLLNARGAHRMGLTPAALAADPGVLASGLGGLFPARRHGFGALRVGPLHLANPAIVVAAVPEAEFDLTLGMDVLGRQRLLLSYAASALSFG